MNVALLKERLVERHQQLFKEVRSELSEHGTHRADGSADLFDFAADANEEEMALQLTSIQMDELNQIEEALQRLGNGDYGRCRDCGHPISEARLEFLPSATLCVHCQETRDQNRQSDDWDDEEDRPLDLSLLKDFQ